MQRPEETAPDLPFTFLQNKPLFPRNNSELFSCWKCYLESFWRGCPLRYGQDGMKLLSDDTGTTIPSLMVDFNGPNVWNGQCFLVEHEIFSCFRVGFFPRNFLFWTSWSSAKFHTQIYFVPCHKVKHINVSINNWTKVVYLLIISASKDIFADMRKKSFHALTKCNFRQSEESVNPFIMCLCVNCEGERSIKTVVLSP